MSDQYDFGGLDYSTLLSSIQLAADQATDGLTHLNIAAPRPTHPIGLGCAARGADLAVSAALDFLGQPTPASLKVGADLHALADRVLPVLRHSATGEILGPRGHRLSTYPAWGMAIALGSTPMPQASLIAAGLALLMAIHEGRRVPLAQARSLKRYGPMCFLTPEQLRILLDSDEDAQDSQWPWLAAIQRRWPAMRNALVMGGGPESKPPSFNRRARGQIFARAHYASPARRAGVPTQRDLSMGQYKHACERVSAWIVQDDWRGTYAHFGQSTGLTIDLVSEILIDNVADIDAVVSVNIDAGTQRADVSFLAEEAAAAPTNGTAVPADLTIHKPLPKLLAQRLQARLHLRPDARKLGDLYPEAHPVEGYMSMIAGEGEIGISWARWINSAGLYMRLDGMDNFMTCILTDDFGHAPRSKLYYAVVTRTEIWAASARFFRDSGLGEPAGAPGAGIAFGSRVVPTTDALRRVLSWHRGEVQQMRPAKSDRSIPRLLEFHNRYTRLIACELALLMALREVKAYALLADVDEELDHWVPILDKAVPGPEGGLPACLCNRAKAAIAAYRVHCRAVGDRLESLGQSNTVLRQRLLEVCRSESIALLCMAAGTSTIRSAGSADAFGPLPAALAITPDAGRKWLENSLRQYGLRTGDVDGALRHDVVGQSRSSSTSDFVLIEWAIRVGKAIDTLAKVVLGAVVTGLARR